MRHSFSVLWPVLFQVSAHLAPSYCALIIQPCLLPGGPRKLHLLSKHAGACTALCILCQKLHVCSWRLPVKCIDLGLSLNAVDKLACRHISDAPSILDDSGHAELRIIVFTGALR